MEAVGGRVVTPVELEQLLDVVRMQGSPMGLRSAFAFAARCGSPVGVRAALLRAPGCHVLARTQ